MDGCMMEHLIVEATLRYYSLVLFFSLLYHIGFNVYTSSVQCAHSCWLQVTSERSPQNLVMLKKEFHFNSSDV